MNDQSINLFNIILVINNYSSRRYFTLWYYIINIIIINWELKVGDWSLEIPWTDSTISIHAGGPQPQRGPRPRAQSWATSKGLKRCCGFVVILKIYMLQQWVSSLHTPLRYLTLFRGGGGNHLCQTLLKCEDDAHHPTIQEIYKAQPE
jgi:hypothetical protein